MKLTGKQLIFWLGYLLVFVACVTFTVLNEYVFENTLSTAALFFMILGFGCGTVTVLKAFFTKKSSSTPFWFLVAGLFYIVGLTLVLTCVVAVAWWIVLLCDILLAIFLVFFSAMAVGNLTEGIAKNKDPEYKNYEERKAEKEEKQAKEAEEPLPELKSFSKEMDEENK